MTHTPGPWTATEPNGRGMGWRAGPAWLGIAAGSKRTAADARLISATLELLAALQAMLDRHPGTQNTTTDQARAAIAKATGRTT